MEGTENMSQTGNMSPWRKTAHTEHTINPSTTVDKWKLQPKGNLEQTVKPTPSGLSHRRRINWLPWGYLFPALPAYLAIRASPSFWESPQGERSRHWLLKRNCRAMKWRGPRDGSRAQLLCPKIGNTSFFSFWGDADFPEPCWIGERALCLKDKNISLRITPLGDSASIFPHEIHGVVQSPRFCAQGKDERKNHATNLVDTVHWVISMSQALS